MLGDLLDPSVVHWLSISVSGACLFNYSDAEVWKVFQDVSAHLAFTTSGCYRHHWRLLVHLQKDFFFFPPPHFLFFSLSLLNKISGPICYINIFVLFISAPRQCTVCGKLAEYECKDCFGEFGVGLDGIAFCAKCLETVSYFVIVITQFLLVTQ